MEIVGIAQRKNSKLEDERSTTSSRGGSKFTDRKVLSINVPRPNKITVVKKPPPVEDTFMVSLPSPEQLAQQAAERRVELDTVDTVDTVYGGTEEYVGYVFAEYPTGTENFVDRVIEVIELDPREKIWYERPWIRVDPFMGALPFEESEVILAPPTPLSNLQPGIISREPSQYNEPDESETSKDKTTKLVPEATADMYDKELEDALMSVLELSPTMTVNKIHCMGETVRFKKGK